MNVRKFYATRQVFYAASILLLASDILLGSILYFRSKSVLTEQIRSNALDIAKTCAVYIDATSFARIGNVSNDAIDRAKTLDSMIRFRDNSEVQFIYSFREAEDGDVIFVIDSDPDKPASYGDEVVATDAVHAALDGTPAADDDPYTDEWGTHIGAYAPIRLGDTIVGAVGVDLDYSWVLQEYRRIRYLIITICVIFFLLGILTIGLIVRSLQQKFILLNEKIEDLHITQGDMSMISGLRQGDEFEVIADHLNEVFIDNRDIMRREAEALKTAKEEAEKNLAARVMLNTLNADVIPAGTKPQTTGTPKTALQAAYDESKALSYDDAMQFLASEDLVDTTLRAFYEDIDHNAEEIERYLKEEDYENLTIRVHALKSSARLIGARALSEDARIIEEMGNRLRPQEG